MSALLLASACVSAWIFWLPESKFQAGTNPARSIESPENEANGPGLGPAEWFFAMREYPTFRPDVQTYTAAIAQANNGVHQRGGNPGFSAAWTVQGPGNIGARVNTIKVDPGNPQVIYIGYSHGGVWKTTDGGQTWKPIFDDQPFLAISDIELDPQNTQVVYVGTGDLNISGYPFIGDGLWKSTDGGQTWKNIGLTNERIVSKIAIHPNKPNTIYVATMGLPFERDNNRGLYKTTDGGQNWQQVLFVSDSTGVIDLQMSPSNPDVLYAATWDRIRNNQESLVSGSNARVWKTTDAGAHWTALEGGLPLEPASRIGLSADAQNSERMLAMYANASLSFQGLYETLDGGQNWQPFPTNGLDYGFQSDFAWYFGKVFINPFNPDDIYVCGVTLWRTIDGGQNWFQTTPDWWLYEVHADAHDMAFVDANTCLLATDGGLYRSEDQGFSWEKIENNPTSQFYRVAYNPFQPEYYYGGMQDNGTTAGNSNDANNWFRLFGGDGFQPVFHPEDPNIYYYETQNGSIYGTADGGGSFLQATDGIDPSDRKHWDMQYILSHHDANIMYTGTQRVYIGFGHQPSWGPISDDLTDGNIFGDRFHTISTLDESALDQDLLYVGTTDGNVWRGNPLSQTWANITTGLPDRYVSSVKASPQFANRVYVAHTGYKSNDFSPHIHRSDDLGNSWAPISGDLPNLAVNDLLILPGHQDSVLFAATDGGVYGTLDGGQHWDRLGSGMPIVPVYDLEINPTHRTLVAGTYARSIMTYPLDSLQFGGDVATHHPAGPAGATLALVANPVQNTATVVLENIPSGQATSLEVLDLQGHRLWTGNCPKGLPRATVQVAVQQFPAGTYLILARTNGQVWSGQKLVVAR